MSYSYLYVEATGGVIKHTASISLSELKSIMNDDGYFVEVPIVVNALVKEVRINDDGEAVRSVVRTTALVRPATVILVEDIPEEFPIYVVGADNEEVASEPDSGNNSSQED